MACKTVTSIFNVIQTAQTQTHTHVHHLTDNPGEPATELTGTLSLYTTVTVIKFLTEDHQDYSQPSSQASKSTHRAWCQVMKTALMTITVHR